MRVLDKMSFKIHNYTFDSPSKNIFKNSTCIALIILGIYPVTVHDKTSLIESTTSAPVVPCKKSFILSV